MRNLTLKEALIAAVCMILIVTVIIGPAVYRDVIGGKPTAEQLLAVELALEKADDIVPPDSAIHWQIEDVIWKMHTKDHNVFQELMHSMRWFE